MTQPLNPALYRAMVAAFGQRNVRIASPGVPMHGSYVPGPDGRQRFVPVTKGEYYVTHCPYCTDLKQRLWINHCWGIRDPVTGDRRFWLAYCFNEDCLRMGDNLDDLKERLIHYHVGAAAGRVHLPAAEYAVGSPLQHVALPKDFVLLSDLERGHPARRYVHGRGFHPDRLARDWGVGYSVNAYCLSSRGRLLVPLRGHVPDKGWCEVGWQARAIHPDEEPKYFTRPGTPKNLLLYGLERVTKDNRPVVICEGVVDVWCAGRNAVAVLGHFIAQEQVELIRQRLGDRPLVLMLDPDVADEAEAEAEKIRAVLALSLRGQHAKSQVVVARLPDERDPGDCTHDEIWNAVRAALSRSTRKRRR